MPVLEVCDRDWNWWQSVNVAVERRLKAAAESDSVNFERRDLVGRMVDGRIVWEPK